MSPAELELAIFQVASAIKLLERTHALNADSDTPDPIHASQLNRLIGSVSQELSYLQALRRPDVAAAVAERESEPCIFHQRQGC